MGDATNNYETLDRALKRIGIILVDDSGFLRNGKSSACVDLLRKLLLNTSVPMAKLLLQRGYPSHAPEKKLVSAAFELVRDKVKFMPSLTVDQFLKEGYAAHKLAILSKLATYISEMDKAFAKAQPPKMMYVVPNDTSTSATNTHSSTANSSRRDDGDLDGSHEMSQLDDLNLSESYADLPPAPPSRSATAPNTHNNHPTAEPKAWPQTDFIKKHILDNSKLQSLNSSPARITAPRSRSTTPNSVRKSSNSSNNMYGIDLYDVEEKTAALEAIQALRAARAGSTDDSMYTSYNTTYNATTPNAKPTNNNNTTNNPNNRNNYSALPSSPSLSKATYGSFSAEPSPAKNNNTLTELAAADLPYHNTTQPNNTLNNTANNYSSIPASTNQGNSYENTTYINSQQEHNYTSNNNSSNYNKDNNNNNSGVSAELVQQMADQRVLHMIESDPAVQKLIDARVEKAVEQRVNQAVQELTTKYDFIINKLVAAVDAEFTLLNNKLALQQHQAP